MRLGVTLFATDLTPPTPEVAREAEDRGFTSLFLPEHTHIPVSRRTPPPTGAAELPEEYRRTVDPLVALAGAATVTDRIRLGTGICLVAQRDPIVTAKAVATLDRVSGGRFVFGIGFGWNEDEITHHGVAMHDRRAVAREHVLVMRALWRDEVAAFRGEHVHLEPSWSWPKPLQPGGPPVLVGGAAGPTLFRHVAEYADGWMPIGGAGVRGALGDLRRACEEAGRDPATVRVVPFASRPERGRLEHYASIGIEEVVLGLPHTGRSGLLRAMDRAATLIGTV